MSRSFKLFSKALKMERRVLMFLADLEALSALEGFCFQAFEQKTVFFEFIESKRFLNGKSDQFEQKKT